MKLRCDKHKKRTVAVEGQFLHRDGTGKCDSPFAHIGETRVSPDGSFKS